MNFDWPKLISEVLSYAEAFTKTTPTPIDDLVASLLRAALERRYPKVGAGPGEVPTEVDLAPEHRAALDTIMVGCDCDDDQCSDPT